MLILHNVQFQVKKDLLQESTARLKGVYGGLATGSVLIGYNNPSENSYGNEQSYNSGISEEMMKNIQKH